MAYGNMEIFWHTVRFSRSQTTLGSWIKSTKSQIQIQLRGFQDHDSRSGGEQCFLSRDASTLIIASTSAIIQLVNNEE